jgi:hypothetical protein
MIAIGTLRGTVQRLGYRAAVANDVDGRGMTGTHGLALTVDEHAYLGNTRFTVSVDGQQIGGMQVTAAIRVAGQTQTLDVMTTFTARQHNVSVDFPNDAYAGTLQKDRNLYISQASINGTSIAWSTLGADERWHAGYQRSDPNACFPDDGPAHQFNGWRINPANPSVGFYPSAR